MLMMTASGEGQRAREGLYLRHLLELWDGGAFSGSFCAMHARLCASVQHENHAQTPQIVMLGAPDPQFPLDIAFHLDRRVMRGGGPGGPVMRGGFY